MLASRGDPVRRVLAEFLALRCHETMSLSVWLPPLIVLADFLIRAALSIRVIMRRLPVGVSLAWLTIILLFPFAGGIVYGVLGEHRLGRNRQRRIQDAQRHWLTVMTTSFPPGSHLLADGRQEDLRLSRMIEHVFGSSVLPGNRVELLGSADETFPALIRDIDAARESVDLQFYIWAPGGRVDEVAAALGRACQRGVRCRLQVDALGSMAFLKSSALTELRANGIEVQAALPSGLLAMPFVRPDLRLHRKIVVIDRQIGYTGSLNMADPTTFKQEAGVGRWIDAMARVHGPGVHALAATFLAAWSVESKVDAPAFEWDADAVRPNPVGPACLQVLPSGPGMRIESIEQVIITAIYSAREELILTTPYFVPDEALLTALLSAASSGVRVTLIVPAQVDSRMVHYASRAFQADLVAAGVNVALYHGGLLHTKSITVDKDVSLFGSLNLDPRSLRLNFEITLAIYDSEFTQSLRQLQTGYLQQATLLDLATCQARPPFVRLVENTARLLGPVL